MSLKALLEKRAKLATKIKELAAPIQTEGRSMTAEETTAWKAVNTDYDQLMQQIEICQRAEQVDKAIAGELDEETGDKPGLDDSIGDEGDQGDEDQGSSRMDRLRRRRGENGEPEGRGRITDEHRALAIQAWFRTQSGEDLTPAHRQACKLVGFNPAKRNLDLQLAPTSDLKRVQRAMSGTHETRRREAVETIFAQREKRAQSSIIAADGGNLVPASMVNSIELAMLAFGPMLQVADIIRTPSGEPMGWPTANDTSNEGRQIGENSAVTELKAAFGQQVWNAFKFTSDEILVPYELMEDSPLNLVQIIGDMLGERLGRIVNRRATVGTGAGTMHGIVTAAAAGHTAASATAISLPDLTNLEHSVDPAYRANAMYMFHDDTLLALKLLTDGMGRPLWQSGMDSGAPDRLNGRAYVINQHMATIATTARSVIFGDLSKYKIRQVGAIRMYRLVERFRENDQDAFIAFTRADGNLLNAGTNPIAALVHP